MMEAILCRVRVKFPQVSANLPRVRLFLPRGVFPVFSQSYLSILLIIKEKETRRKREKGRFQSHGLGINFHGLARWSKKHPRVRNSPTGQPVGTINKYNQWDRVEKRGLHGSTGCFPPAFLLEVKWTS